ncbi:uncharacterized protein [Argopecten irradians]|uniref:uncharacterized protein isoform X5 n=1 Tax=Argopecten irradians TaxID=31199 RepID=UPI00371FBE46
MERSKIYAGITFNENLKSDLAMQESTAKNRRKLNSFISIGIHKNGMNPISSVSIWKKVILPSLLFGCELWSNFSNTTLNDMEIFQCQAARRIQGFDTRSPKAVTISSLGLSEINAEIQKYKLFFWNKLYTGDGVFLRKQLFHVRLKTCTTNNINSLGFIPDVHNIMKNYNIEIFFGFNNPDDDIPPKGQWKQFIKRIVQNREEEKWRESLAAKESLHIFASIHTKLDTHPLWKISKLSVKDTWQMSDLIHLSFVWEVVPVICKLCGKTVTDIVVHFLIECHILFAERDLILEIIVNFLHVNDYVTFTNMSETDQTKFILGRRSQDIDLSDENWTEMMKYISKLIPKMYAKIDEYL